MGKLKINNVESDAFQTVKSPEIAFACLQLTFCYGNLKSAVVLRPHTQTHKNKKISFSFEDIRKKVI